MKTRVTARHFEMNEETRNYVVEALDGLERFYGRIMDSRAILTREKDRWNADLVLSVSGATLTAESEDDLLFAAVDDAVAKLERQLKKYKAKVRHEKDRREAQQQKAAVAGGNRSS